MDMQNKQILFLLMGLLISFSIFSKDRIVNLTISYKTVYFAGKPRTAIAVNNQIPGPTLHFRQGDHVTIHVHNQLNQGTSIHWHGILVPWQMDGVDGVTQKPIPPGGTFDYRFTLYQSGTYWYHSHVGLQEQQGLYGAFIIDPPKPPPYNYNKDVVVVLSDWSNTDPDQVLANLKKEGDYYSPRFPLQPSLAKFIHDYRQSTPQERRLLINDYKMMQQMRMGVYDFSDVAYNAFLLNGQTKTQPWTTLVKVGDTVRLRFIDAGASTNFKVKIPGTLMRVVHIQGNNIQPYQTDQFFITPGETVDVLVKIQKNNPHIIYAESSDTLGAAYGALITQANQVIDYAQVKPFPEPIPVTREMMTNMMKIPPTEKGTMNAMPMHQDASVSHSMSMNMPTEPTIKGDVISPPNCCQATTHGTKYQQLTAAVQTNDPTKKVDGVIRMELFGYMDRYIWMINGLPEYKANPIRIEQGKRYRIIFTNHSMMHHPMHIHGHWFILRNGHGTHDPLLHTMDVPPGATIVADIDSDASGQWIFHCHHLYHMAAGMARVFQYTTIIDIIHGKMKPQSIAAMTPYVNRAIIREDEVIPIDLSLIAHPMAHNHEMYFLNAVEASEDPFHNVQEVSYLGRFGPDYNKVELQMKEFQVTQGSVENADLDIFYWRLLSQFWAIKGGVNYLNQPAGTPYWQPGIGVEGLMPYFVATDTRLYEHKGSIKFDIEVSRDTQITNNFFVQLGVRGIIGTKTVGNGEIGSGFNEMEYTFKPYYRVMPGINVFVKYEFQQDYGDYKNFEKLANSPTTQNIVAGGFAAIL